MARIFLSYHRGSELHAKTLADDLRALGHTVWFDQELSGGQSWWDQILAVIRDSDVFVFLLNQGSLDSVACQREYGYAEELGKPILPVVVSGGVSTNLLAPALSRIQFVDYRTPDRDAAFRLARALSQIPPPGPLPDPLPAPPAIPVSYLGGLSAQVDATSPLNYEQQGALVLDLKRCLREPTSARDARMLLERLRKRRDVYATVAEEINELLAGPKRVSSDDYDPLRDDAATAIPPAPPPVTVDAQAQRPALGAPGPFVSPGERIKCAGVGAIVGTVVGVTAMTTVGLSVDETIRSSVVTGLAPPSREPSVENESSSSPLRS